MAGTKGHPGTGAGHRQHSHRRPQPGAAGRGGRVAGHHAQSRGPADHRVQRGRKAGTSLCAEAGPCLSVPLGQAPALCADGGTAPHGREAQPDGHGGRPALCRPDGCRPVRHPRPDGDPPRPGPGRAGHPQAQVGEKTLAEILRPGREDPVSDDWKIRFGTAGTSDSFAAQGYKTSLEVPEYTAKMGLNAFEYQCGRGVRLGLDKAAKMAALAAPKDILFSVHAPYYISMSSLEEDKRLNSIQYLLQSAAVCRALGGKRIIFHSGSCGKQSREAALEKALDTMRRAVEALDEAGFADMTLCPETMGKVGQLGTLDEVLALCGVDERITPCIDFGHLNARTLGGIQSKADYAVILDRMSEALGDERARRFHVHFSRIEYSKGGEKRHWTFAETQFGPEPQPLMELLAERGLAPVVICESAGTQAEDACTMQQMYRAAQDLRKIL
mgnify:CR=1 FL=1